MTDEAIQENQETSSENSSSAKELPPEVKAKLEELERLKAHHGKLLDETKTAKQRAKELEEAREKAEKEALEKSGEFQKLWESESEKAARLQRELEEKESVWREKERERQQREIESRAIQDMKNIAVDDSSLELLSEKAQKFAVYTENGIEYQIGGVTVPKEKVIETLSEKYPRLVKGSGASGGGASGGSKGGSAATINRSKMTAEEKAAYVKEHGQAAFLKLPK